MTDYKALCAELVEQLNQVSAHIEATTPFETVLSGLRAYNRARNALAQPEPEGPSKAELRQIFDDQSGFINDEQVMWWSDFQPAARAVLARWGNL
jgi:hypothetical protein